MRRSITPPDLTASSGPDAVVSSSSETPEPARASRERPKDIEDVILVKFVLLVSVHTTSVNGAHFSEASNFQVLLCLNVLQSRAHGEQAHKCLEQTQPQPDYPAYILSRSCLKVVWFRGVIMVFLIFSVHSGKDSLNVSFSSMIRFQSHSSNEGHDGRQRQVKVGSVVSCRTDTAVLRWQEDVGSPPVNTFSLNKDLFYVLLTCICMCLL